MKISRIMALVFLTSMGSLAVVAFFLLQPVPYKEYQGDGFTCTVPAGSPGLLFEEYGWHKHNFAGKRDLYISHRSLEGSFQEEVELLGKHLQGAAFQKRIRVFDDGWFFLFARGKSWRKYIYLFPVGQEVFWVESATRHSTMLTYKEVADRVVTSLDVGGRTCDPSLPGVIEEVNREILRYSQSPRLLFSILAASMIGLTVFVGGILSLAGSIPSLPSGQIPIRQEGRIYLVTRSKWKYQGTMGALVLTSEALILYYFRRPICSLSRGEQEKLSLGDKRGKSFLEIQEGKKTFQIHVSDPHAWLNEIRSQLQ